MSFNRPLFILLIAVFCSFPSYAGVFNPPPADQSMSILGMIFGNNVGQIILGGQANPALNHMFEMLNIVAVTIGTIIVSYIGVISTINTAQEGQAMGKKWSSIWIPARSVLGMMVLAPTPGSGYSVIQVAIMWTITQGIGAADKIWSGLLTNYSQGSNASTGIVFDAHSDNVADSITQRQLNNIIVTGDNLSEQLLNSATASATLQNIYLRNLDHRKSTSEEIRKFAHLLNIYTVIGDPIINSDNSVTQTATLYIGVKGHPQYYNLCGEYKVSANVDPSELKSDQEVKTSELKNKAFSIVNTKLRAMANIYAKMFTLARGIAEERITTKGYRALCTNNYVNSLSVLTKNNHIDYDLNNLLEQKRQDGWLSAGGFYFRFNKARNNSLFYSVANETPQALDIPKCTEPSCSAISYEYNSSLTRFYDFIGNKEHVATLANNLYEAHVRFSNDDYRFDSNGGGTSTYKKILSQINDNISNEHQNKLHNFVNELVSKGKIKQILEMLENKNADPLYIISAFGNEILLETEDLMLDFLKHPDRFIDKLRKVIGGDQNQQKKMQHELFITTVGIGVFLAMWTAGASLALYIPFIPFLIFTVGSIGWLMLVIEAMVAAPLFAISFILPSGEELGKIAQGLMLLVNILLRPVLMLFGFILASRLFRAVFFLVHKGLFQHINDMALDSSILGSIALLVMYIAFTVSLANKCFSLIYIIPDKALRWMGGAPEQTDISQESQAAKGGIQKAGDIAQKVASGAAMEDLYRRNMMLNKYTTPPAVESEAYRPEEQPEYAE